MSDDTRGYVDYFEVLGVDEEVTPGHVRKVYRQKMKALVGEIGQVEITEDRRAHYLLEMAKLNAALLVLRETPLREVYVQARKELIELEAHWRKADEADAPDTDSYRRQFDGRVREFLSKYVEEMMLTAGHDKECVEHSHWDEAHERHAFRILRHYRQGLYQQILERLPFAEVTRPEIDWDERRRTVSTILASSQHTGVCLPRERERGRSLMSGG